MVRPAAQQLVARGDGLALLGLGAQRLQLGPVFGELGAEVRDAAAGLFGFFGDQLGFGEGGVVVDGAGEGG